MLRRADLAATAFLVALTVVLYRKVVRLWWVFDDTNLLRTLYDTKPLDAWTSAAVWPQQLFTPLMFSAFEAQLAMFELDTTRWYIAHVAITCVAVVAIYFACRAYLDVAPSLAASALFALGTPMCSLVDQLSTVHYFIAIAFCALAVIAMRRAPALSAVFYFAAMLAKEIAVPLPLLLAFLPGERRPRVRALAGHAIALAAYLLWRRAVIGAFFGSYSWAVEPGDWPMLLLTLPWKIVRAFAGVDAVTGLILAAIMLLPIVSAIARNRRALPLALAAIVVSIVPLLGVAQDIHRRYAVIPWLAASVAFAAGAASLRDRRYAAALLIGVPLLTVPVNRQEWAHEFRERLQMSDEGRFFIDMPPGLLRAPLTPPPVMRELDWLRVTVLKKPGGASAFFDDYFLCANDVRDQRVWQYKRPKRAVVEITDAIGAIGARHCATLDFKRPLSATFRYKNEALFWELGPYERGTYRGLLGEGREAWVLPRRGGLNLRGLKQLTIRIRYDSPEGWTTYSPPIELEFRKRPVTTWRR